MPGSNLNILCHDTTTVILLTIHPKVGCVGYLVLSRPATVSPLTDRVWPALVDKQTARVVSQTIFSVCTYEGCVSDS